MNSTVGNIAGSRQLRALLMFLGLAWLVWVLANWILNGDMQDLELGSMAIAMVIITATILVDWRAGFFMFLFWLMFEDLSRKYLGNGTILFFGKDALAAITYISLLIAKRRGQVKWFRSLFFVPLGLFIALAVVQVFNTNSPSILYGLLGLSVYFYFVPLMFVGYAMLRNGKDLDRFLLFTMALGFLIALLGIVQSIVGLQFLNPVTLDSNIKDLASLTRYSPITHRAVPVPTSVFVSGGRFSIYMVLLIILAMGTQAYILLRGRKGALLGFLGIGMALVGAMQSGSRGAIVYTITSVLVISAAMLWGAPREGSGGQRLRKAIRQAILVGVAGLFLMAAVFPDAIGPRWAFYSETLDPRSTTFEAGFRIYDYPLRNLELAFQDGHWLLGRGTGTTSLGAQYIVRLTGLRNNNATVENGYGQLILEMGIAGLVLWIVWTSIFLISAWKIVKGLRGTAYFPIAFSIFWYSLLLLVPFTYGGLDSYQNFVMNAYFWILAGILFRLPELARMPQAATSFAKAPVMAKAVSVPAYARGLSSNY